MKRFLTSIICAIIVITTVSAQHSYNRAEWRMSKKGNKASAAYQQTNKYPSSVGVEATISHHNKSGKLQPAKLSEKGFVTAEGATKGSYWLMEMPVEQIAAGTVVDVWLPFSTLPEKENHSFAFEYRDGKKWHLVTPIDKSGANCKSTTSSKHITRLWHSFRVNKEIKDGSLAVRLRQVENKPITSSVCCPSSRGQYPQMICLDNIVPRDTLKMLFIGNSYTYYHTYPVIFKEIAWSQKHYADCDIFISGGYTMKAHLANKYSREVVARGGFDYVMLQDQSFRPTLKDTEDDEGALEYLQKMVTFVRDHSPKANILLEITWGRKHGSNNLGKKYEHLKDKYPHIFANYDSMQNRLIEALTEEAEATGIGLNPVGIAWQIVFHERPDIELYHTDAHHQSYAGSYLSAAVVYQTIYRQPFDENVSDAKLPHDVAAYLRSVAERVVLKGERWQKK